MSAVGRTAPHALLVASTGGHLTQLVELADRFEPALAARTWVTSPGPQADELERSYVVRREPPIVSRDWRGVVAGARRARAVLRDVQPDLVVSTGAAVALAYLPAARAAGVRAVYIESATRVAGPSVTGRLLEVVPGIERYTQHPWQRRNWRQGVSVFDGFRAVPAPRSGDACRLLVTVGTQQGYGFRRMIEHLVAVLPSQWEVTWQTGGTPVDDLAIVARPFIPADELQHLMATADVVVSHAGTGSALSALHAGKVPVLVPRTHATGEHVDDHQQQTAAYLAGRGLAVVADAHALTLEVLERAAERRVVRDATPPFLLDAT
jgi:UDP-N-acetylglucosamine:LPS N-acetylglucosamine transferase